MKLGFLQLRTAAVLLSTLPLGLGGCRREPGDFVTLMNRGKAFLENRDSKNAIEAFERATRADPDSAAAQRNLARAHRLARQPERAVTALQQAEQLQPQSAANSYLIGLTLLSLSRPDDALEYLEQAVRLDPDLAPLRFQLAGAYESTGDEDGAVEQLHETIRLDPLHASAHFKLATYYRRVQEVEAFQRHHTEFLRLRQLFGDETRSPEALETCVYTLPEAPAVTLPREPSAPPPIDVHFVDATDAAFRSEAGRRASCVSVLRVDKSGGVTLFGAEADGAALLTMTPSGVFERGAVEGVSLSGGLVHECRAGDFHNDVPAGASYDPEVHAFNDLALLVDGELRLLKQTSRGRFQEVTDEAGLAGVSGQTVRWVDYEHDGDLDLLVGTAAGMGLWQNNGNGTFTDVTSDAGIEVDGPVVGLAAVDLDNNVAIDLIAARAVGPMSDADSTFPRSEPTLVFMNQRTGRFARMVQPPGPWPAASLVFADDLSNDGRADVLLLSDGGATILYGGSAERDRLDLAGIDVSDAALLDFDNDGRLDLWVVGTEQEARDRGVVRLFRNGGPGVWIDASKAVGLTNGGSETGAAARSWPPVQRVLAADVDNDGDSDLLLVTADARIRFLRNDGGNRNRQLKVRLATIKSNPTGIGVRLEVRAGDFWLTRTVSSAVIEIGLSDRAKLDAVQTLWTNGIVDNVIDVSAPAAPLTIIERNIAAGSCPFLYARDGERFRFVTDLLGNSPIGLPLTREQMLPADPDEIVAIGPEGVFRPRDGYYTLAVTDEFREVVYLDFASLRAVDHRPGVEVHPTDKLMPPPFPPSAIRALGSRQSLRRAIGDDGVDRTEAVREIDGLFAPGGAPLPPPYRGMCHPLALELEFDSLDAAKPLVLALTGWLQYGDASTNIALSQNPEVAVQGPALEAQTADGQWMALDVVVGAPAGKTKTILVDLAGKLPLRVRKLRLTTTLEIRWDRIALFEAAPLAPGTIHELSADEAELKWRGFSELIARAPGHPTTPDFASVVERPPWRTALQGWCTRYGDVKELIAARDDQLAILNAGDALILRFRSDRLPPVPADMARTFFFYSVGWDKDGDHNVATGHSVEPLPVGLLPAPGAPGTTQRESPELRAPDEHDWRIRYNTRWVPFDRFDGS